MWESYWSQFKSECDQSKVQTFIRQFEVNKALKHTVDIITAQVYKVKAVYTNKAFYIYIKVQMFSDTFLLLPTNVGAACFVK